MHWQCFYRTYSRRKKDGSRENFKEAMTRAVDAAAGVDSYTEAERQLVLEQALQQRCFPSGRAFWVAGTIGLKSARTLVVSTTALVQTSLT